MTFGDLWSRPCENVEQVNCCVDFVSLTMAVCVTSLLAGDVILERRSAQLGRHLCLRGSQCSVVDYMVVMRA